MNRILEPFFNIFRFHKLKILALFGLYLVFAYLLFPFNDLGDLVAAKVSELTAGQVFVDFDKLDLSFLPQPGLELSNVTVDTVFTGSLNAKTLSVSPNIPGLISLKPGVNVHADGLFGGTVDLDTRGGDKTPSGKRKQRVMLDLAGLNLGALGKMAELPLKVEGSVTGSVDSQVDVDFVEQPSAQIQLHIDKASLPEGPVNTLMGPMTLPRINLSAIDLEGTTDRGSVDITKLVIGKPGTDVYANVTGHMDLKIQKMGNSLAPLPGGYDFNIHLQVGEGFKQKMGNYLSLLSAYSSGANAYAIRVSSATAFGPPSITRLQ